MGAVLLGAAGASLLAGVLLDQPLQIVTPSAHDPAPEGAAATGRQFLDRARGLERAAGVRPAAEINAERRALYREFAQGGTTVVGSRVVTPNLASTSPIEQGGGRTEYAPLRASNGKRVYFLYGFQPGGSSLEQLRAKIHRATIDDDIDAARSKGYTVIVDREATEADVLAAAYDPAAAGIVWTAHGTTGGFITTSDGRFIKPIDLEAARVSKNLRFVVLQACHSDEDPSWQTLFPGAKVITFEGKTRWRTILDFNRPNGAAGDYLSGNPTELDDIIRDRL